jgi:hypothetical protein
MIGGAAVLGIGGLIYYLTTKSSSGGGGKGGTNPTPGSVVLQSGAQSITIPKTGQLTLTLPPGGTWIGGTNAGTSTPVVFQSSAFKAADTVPISLVWNLNGVAQTTFLTITVQ